jgi:F0F1-type ATP synthase assembly protein I
LDLRERRETYNGAGDALARAFELVVTPLCFGIGGWLIDRRLGTAPVFMLVLFAVCLAGLATKFYFGYVEEMKAHEARLFGHRDRPTGPATPPTPTRPEEPAR